MVVLLRTSKHGFPYATLAGGSIGIEDIWSRPTKKRGIIEQKLSGVEKT